MNTETIRCWATHTEDKETLHWNGGARTLGDGMGKRRLYIKQGLQGMILNEDDIKELLKALSLFDARIR